MTGIATVSGGSEHDYAVGKIVRSHAVDYDTEDTGLLRQAYTGATITHCTAPSAAGIQPGQGHKQLSAQTTATGSTPPLSCIACA